jgi:dTDP-4-amino-4,6-dideoxygalactose transaminase
MSTELAMHGGQPVRETFLPFHQPWLGEEEEQELLDTLRSGWLTTGPKTKLFERRFSEYVGSKHAIAVNSCTAALHLSLVAAGVQAGDEIITTPFTFAATANVCLHQGAHPVFVDIQLDTLNMDPTLVEDKVTAQTKCIIPVHLAGHPCDMDSILSLAETHGLTVVEDAAHAIESEYKGRKVGSIGDMTAFSFYATKNMTTGEGGMLTTNDDQLADKARILSLHGISKDAWKRYSDEGYRHYDIIYPGYKYNMFDIQASLGLHQLDKLEDFWRRRKHYTQLYNQAFAQIPEVLTLSEADDVRHAYHLYIILVKTEKLGADRDTIMRAIQAENVGVGVHFRTIHLHPYYETAFGYRRGDFPRAEYASDRVISLPLYPKMSEQDVRDVIAVVQRVISAYRR